MKLWKLQRFLGIKKKLENIRQNVQESIEDVDKTIGKIDAFGKGMREAGQKIANTFRTFPNKLEKEYGEKKFSKTELIKKPFQARRKLLSGILKCVDAAIEKTEQLVAEVRQYQTDKAERRKKTLATQRLLTRQSLQGWNRSSSMGRRLLRHSSRKQRKPRLGIKQQRMCLQRTERADREKSS